MLKGSVMSSSPIKKWVDLLSTTKICGIFEVSYYKSEEG